MYPIVVLDDLSADDAGKALLANFSCGDAALDNFLHNEALHLHNAGITRSLLFLSPNQEEIVAWAALSASETHLSDFEIGELSINSMLPTRFIPSVRLTKFALAAKYQKQGLGSLVLSRVKDYLISNINSLCAYRLLVLDARNDESVLAFYRRNGFEECAQETRNKKHDRDRSSVEMYFDLLNLSQ
ncbi:GNAT family N-acetyltransferase [Suttonella indologenes]|uniref:N-acetyltransferase domain-containing protein n=1 Tax=Suttonella indologenes TaxID=13276 RepID=A0A380MJV2_9GAMM|nr:GNAT family N-acetyltransferase [Suttonella indologenes]SUO91519.1 Uncharacterised protein [Suttonella indologenes]